MGCSQSAEMAFSNRGSTTGVILDKETLEGYMATEKSIEEFHHANPDIISQLEVKSESLEKLEEKTVRLQEEYTEIQNNQTREGDVKSTTKSTLRRMSTIDDITPRDEHQLANVNKMEIKKQKLDEGLRQKECVEKEVGELQSKAEQLQQIYTTQDNYLGKIFGGEYGSAKERQLELQLDALQTQKARIMEASFKWRQAQMMMEYACKQLAVAVQKWQDLPQIPVIDLEIRYTMATETRDNLVAASQNMNGAQQYLDNVQLPYCTPDEVQTLNKATNYVFTDMQSDDRYDHAQSCYTISHQRAVALLQWMDQVLNTTIMQDMVEVDKRVKETASSLREERIRLIKQKAKEVWGADIQVEIGPDPSTDDDINQMMNTAISDNEIVKTDLSDISGTAARQSVSSGDDNDVAMAPLPSNEAIFGQSYDEFKQELDNMRIQHETEMSQFMQEQDRQAARIRTSLEAKLEARRRTRAIKNLEKRQKEELEENNTNGA